LSQYKPKWKYKSQSDLSSVFELTQNLNNTKAVLRLIVYNGIKRLDYEVDLLNWDGTKSREFRLAFPLNQKGSKVSYEVPFAKVTVGHDEIPGSAGERYQQIAKDLHPREVLDWISSSDSNSGIAFSSSVAVWDYIDPTDNPVDYTILQPVLLASRKSCHWEGNWYLQKGDHSYRFSLTSHKSGWENGYKQAKGFNIPLWSTQLKNNSSKAKLPQAFSFLNLSASNVFLSTLKKAEDKDNIVMRVYEMEGRSIGLNANLLNEPVQFQKMNLIEEINEDTKTQFRSSVKIGKFTIEAFNIDNHSEK
jgi:alpha-mannosidase